MSLIENYFGKTEIMDTLFVAEDNGIIKGFMEIWGTEIGKLYVEPCFQSGGIGVHFIIVMALSKPEKKNTKRVPQSIC